MSSFGMNTRSQMCAPFIDSFIHDRLLLSMPHGPDTPSVRWCH